MIKINAPIKQSKIIKSMEACERKAWTALGGYKFWMFGYYAAQWVNLNKLLPARQRNPFFSAVQLARQKSTERMGA